MGDERLIVSNPYPSHMQFVRPCRSRDFFALEESFVCFLGFCVLAEGRSDVRWIQAKEALRI